MISEQIRGRINNNKSITISEFHTRNQIKKLLNFFCFILFFLVCSSLLSVRKVRYCCVMFLLLFILPGICPDIALLRFLLLFILAVICSKIGVFQLLFILTRVQLDIIVLCLCYCVSWQESAQRSSDAYLRGQLENTSQQVEEFKVRVVFCSLTSSFIKNINILIYQKHQYPHLSVITSVKSTSSSIKNIHFLIYLQEHQHPHLLS